MDFFLYMPPALILILGGLLIAFSPLWLRQSVMLIVPIITLSAVMQSVSMPDMIVHFAGFELKPLVMHDYTRIFATVFSLAALAGAIYGLEIHKPYEISAGFIYAGSAIGVTYSGDMVSLFLYWEIMAIASTIVVLSGGTKKAVKAGTRYAYMHFLGGVFLLAGIVSYAQIVGSTDVSHLPLTTDAVLDVLMGNGDGKTIALCLILLGVLVNVAAPPFSAWLPDAYPEATPLGAVFLSAFTTKTAVFVLLTLFAGLDILIYLGVFMIFYGIVYAMLENDMRRILSYSIVNQVGFMVTGVGMATIGTKYGLLAAQGVALHAFCHIIYKALLLMSAGSVIHMTGKHKCSEVGGLYHTMKLTMICGIIGALAISAFPFTSGFVSKSLISGAAGGLGEAGKIGAWVWYALMAASAGVFLHAGIKFPWFVFFHRDQGLRPKEPPLPMKVAMIFLSVMCILPAIPGLGVPLLYGLLNTDVYYPVYTGEYLISQLQLLLFAGLVFFLFIKYTKWLERTDTISLDMDYLYRVTIKNALLLIEILDKHIYRFVIKDINWVIKRVMRKAHFYHKPNGIMACNWGVGMTVLSSILLLGVFLILYYFKV